MTEDLKHIEQIENYFEGKMSPKEKSAFEALLIIDEDLKEEFDKEGKNLKRKDEFEQEEDWKDEFKEEELKFEEEGEKCLKRRRKSV